MNFEYFNLDNYLSEKQKREDFSRMAESHSENIEKAKRIAMRKIEYPQYEEAFDYVDKLFPEVSVKKVILYKLTNKQFEKLGFGFAGGLYDKIGRTILIGGGSCKKTSKWSAKISVDEIIVHELLHYASIIMGVMMSSVEAAEDFAYGWSLGYLRYKGHSDDNIIKNNYLPYLVDFFSEKAFEEVIYLNNLSVEDYNNFSRYKKQSFYKRNYRKLEKIVEEKAWEKGRNIISVYDKKIKEKEMSHVSADDISLNRFDCLDIL